MEVKPSRASIPGSTPCWLYERSRSLWPSVVTRYSLDVIPVLAALGGSEAGAG